MLEMLCYLNWNLNTNTCAPYCKKCSDTNIQLRIRLCGANQMVQTWNDSGCISELIIKRRKSTLKTALYEYIKKTTTSPTRQLTWLNSYGILMVSRPIYACFCSFLITMLFDTALCPPPLLKHKTRCMKPMGATLHKQSKPNCAKMHLIMNTK